MITKCATCGKKTVILYPEKWVYKRTPRNGIKHFCSWGCMRKFDKGEIDNMKDEKTAKRNQRNRLELGQKVMELLAAGQSPIPFLKEIGYANPQMAYADIKKACIKADPSLADKFPESIRGLKKPVETPEGNATVVATKEPPRPIAGGEWEKMETPEGPKIGGLCPPVAYQDEITAWKDGKPVERIAQPVKVDGMTVRELEGDFGRYRYTAVAGNEYIDYECPEGLDTISLSVKQWKNFRAEQAKAARILGVEL